MPLFLFRPTILTSTSDRRQIALWSLILAAAAIPHRIRRRDDTSWALLVPETLIARAAEELKLYEQENRHWPPARPDTDSPHPGKPNHSMNFSVWIGLALFFQVTGPWYADNPWFAAGAIDRGRMLAGAEWWRLVTALTLHADSAHLFGNLFFGGILASFLGRSLGLGLAWSMTLCAAVLANGINLSLHAEPYRSVGFSTAVFAMVGILSGIRSRQGGSRERLLALGSGAGLLALLGSTGEQVDLGAHFWGICLGFVTGLALDASGLSDGRAIGSLRQFCLFFLVVALVLFCWLMALSR